MISLENKRVIVTGAASGIGKAITLKCIEYGSSVIAIDINSAGLEILKKGIGVEKNIYS